MAMAAHGRNGQQQQRGSQTLTKGEKRGCRTQGKEDGGRREEGDESDATREGDVERSRKKIGKRLGRSLRTHPQPESTTFSVPTMKDLPA